MRGDSLREQTASYDRPVTSKRALKRTRITLGLVLLASMAACGSTASPYRQAALRNGNQDAGLTTGDGSSTVDSVAGTNADGSPSATQPGGAVRSTATTRGTTNGSIKSGPRPNGPGVTDGTITIGMVEVTNNAAAQAALGNSSATSGDPKGEAQAVIKDINAHGGVRGRKLAVIFHPVDATSAQSTDQVEQSTCADFTQDHKVLVTIGFASANYLACTAKAGTVATAGSLSSLSDADYAKNPLFYDVQAISTNKLVRNFVAELARDGYFSGWDAASGAPGKNPVKVGIVIPDQPQWDAVLDKVLLPALAALGHPVASGDVQRWHFPESNADNGSSIAQIQSAILRFRSDNVTHVLPMDVNSIGFFAQPAEAQHYRPRYGLNTATQVGSFIGGLIPAVQLHGAIGLGWSPALDLPAANNPANGPYAGPGTKHCLDVMSAAGFTFSDANARGVALLVCDEWYSIRDAINAIPSGGPIDASSFIQGIESLGSKFSIAGLPIGTFGPGKHFPVTRGYRWSFDEPCSCMHYVGAPFELS